MNCEILAVGTELLLGDIVNTNAQYIAKGLSDIGLNVFYQTVVGDNPARLSDCLDIAKSRADIIITTGGLGPTYDDLTKEVIARNFGRKLKMHEESLNILRGYFSKRGHTMTPNNEKQAMMPEDSIVIPNYNGTAPGCIIEGTDNKIAIMMPGPPREMMPMFSNQVIPYLKKFSDEVIVSHTLRIIGMGESLVEDKLHEMMLTMQNPTVAPYAKEGECIVRVTAKAKSDEEAIKLIDPVVDQIHAIIGDVIYGTGEEPLESCVVKMLIESGLKVALAESCTGGLLASRITDIPGSSKCFDLGVVSYANEAKEDILGVSKATLLAEGAVSKRCAYEMAHGIYYLSGADFGVSITGIAGPSGGTPEKPVGLVYVALFDGRKTWIKEINYARDRRRVRLTAANNALDMIRRSILYANPKI